jgi:4-hydroxy-2-oxoheptanedioate aldolase
VFQLWRDRLGENLEAGRSSLGLLVNDVEFVELTAHMGFDWFMIELMFGTSDWSKTSDLIRAGEAYGITPVVRVQSAPWVIKDDPRIAVDISRAFGIGAQYVMLSNSGLAEVKQAAEISHDWHRRAATIHQFSDFDEWDKKIGELAGNNVVIPQPETLGALDCVEESLALPEIRLLMFAMTDASKVLANSSRPDWELPELWTRLKRAIDIADASGKAIGANTSYAYTLEEMRDRAVRLHEAGVKMIFCQPAAFLFQLAIGAFLKDTRDRMK